MRMEMLWLLSIMVVKVVMATNVNQAATEILKGHYHAKYGQHMESTLDDIVHERMFIDLNIVRKSDTHRDHVTSQIDNKPMKLDQLFDDDGKQFIVFEGDGGVGKSHLMEQIVIQWADGSLMKGVRYLFLLKCPELSELKVPNLEILLYLTYGTAFQHISYFDIMKHSNETVIIIDGLEDCMKKKNESFDFLIDPEKNLLYESKFIITGRPSSIQSFRQRYQGDKARRYGYHSNVKEFEVLGFSEGNVNEFIETMLANNSVAIKTVKNLIGGNDRLKMISRLPEYLKLMCDLSESREHLLMETLTEKFVL